MNSISLYEKRDALRRLLESKHFAKARKKSRFLEFVCEQTFLGNSEKLNEYLIGAEIYERGGEFNPQEDSIVRVQAHEIRRCLKEYYDDEGKDDPWRIDLPPGHYVPTFSRASRPEGASPTEQPGPPPQPASKLRRYGLVVFLALVCAILGSLLVREKLAPSNVSLSERAGGLPEEMRWFWGPFLPPAEAPLVVIPNHPLLRAAHGGDSPATLNRSHLIPKEKLSEFRDTIHYRELEGFYFVPSTTDFTSVGEALGLLNFFRLFDMADQTIHLKPSRLVDFEEVKRGSAILLGATNPGAAGFFSTRRGSGSITASSRTRPRVPASSQSTSRNSTPSPTVSDAIMPWC